MTIDHSRKIFTVIIYKHVHVAFQISARGKKYSEKQCPRVATLEKAF